MTEEKHGFPRSCEIATISQAFTNYLLTFLRHANVLLSLLLDFISTPYYWDTYFFIRTFSCGTVLIIVVKYFFRVHAYLEAYHFSDFKISISREKHNFFEGEAIA